MEVYLKDSDGEQICFKHAVKAALKKDEDISVIAFDDSDCGMSGAWWLSGCKICEKELER